MSNADLIRQMWDAFERRDTEAGRAILHPDIVWDATRLEMPDGAEVYRGHEGVAEYWRRWLGAWETLHISEPEVIEAGDKVFVWVVGQVNRGRTSGIEVEQPPFGFVWTFAEGRAVRMELYMDRAEALSAAGLD